MSEHNWQLKRNLEERAHLTFEFPTTSGKPYNIRLPFFQNPVIKESKKSRLNTYNPISRSSSLFSYNGGEAREFNLNFDLTLDHLMNYSLNFNKFVLSKSVNTQRDAFFTPPSEKPEDMPHNVNKEKEEYRRSLTSESIKTENQIVYPYYSKSYSDKTPLNVITNSKIPFQQGYRADFGDVKSIVSRLVANTGLTQRDKTIEIVLFWVNLIRASVLNNSINPMLGPPIIRVKYGILFNYVPCVCSDYSIEEDTKAGQDVITLFPRVLKVSLKLLEVRAGDFDKFSENGKLINKDGLAGWESVLGSPYTLDPGS